MGSSSDLHYAKDFISVTTNEKNVSLFNYHVLNSLACSVCVLNESGDIVAVNDSWLSFGRQNEANLDTIIPGNNYLQACRNAIDSAEDSYASSALDGIGKVIAAKLDQYEIEYPCHSSEVQRWFLMQCTSMIDSERRVVIAHFDISRSKMLEKRLLAKENEMQAISDIHRQANAEIHLDRVIRTILQQVSKTLKPDLCLLFLAEGNELKLRDFYPDNEDLLEHTQTKHKVGLCLCGLSISQKKSIYALDIHHDPRCTLQECKKAGIRSFASIPLTKNAEVIGCLGVASKEVRDFSENSTFLESVAEDVALCLDNALLYDKLEMYSQKLQNELEARKKLEEQLIHKHKMEAVGTLSSGIAHDFNNILAAILGYTECAKGEIEPGSQAHDDLDEVLTAGKRAAELIRQILNFSQKKTEQFKPINLSPTIAETVQMIRATIPTTIEIKTVIEGDDITIQGSESQLQQVLLNLFTNSAHAMEKEGGALAVKLKVRQINKADSADLNLKPGDYAHIAVTDTGKGISAENIDKIFDPYFTTKKMGKGSGIGLSVVAGIIASHDGEIFVDSTVGKGTRFDLYLPLTNEPVPSLNETAVQGIKGNEHVLIVDDEPAIVNLLKRKLEYWGYQVSAFCESPKALSAFERQPQAFDLIITDQAMPKLPGDKLLKAIKKIRPSVPVIICTGYNSIISDSGNDYGDAHTLLMKPINMSILAQSMRKAIDVSKANPSSTQF